MSDVTGETRCRCGMMRLTKLTCETGQRSKRNDATLAGEKIGFEEFSGQTGNAAEMRVDDLAPLGWGQFAQGRVRCQSAGMDDDIEQCFFLVQVLLELTRRGRRCKIQRKAASANRAHHRFQACPIRLGIDANDFGTLCV